VLFRFSYFFTSVLVTCISFLFLTSSSYSVIQITSLFSWLRLYNFCNFVDSTNNVEYCEGRYSCVVCPSVRLSVCRCDKLKSLDGINKPRHFAETDTNAFVLKQHCIRQGPGPHGKMIGGGQNSQSKFALQVATNPTLGLGRYRLRQNDCITIKYSSTET